MISTIAVPNRKVGVPLVMIAGICWSTSGLIYRLIEQASPWQVLFYRSLALFVMLVIWLVVNYHKNFFSIFSNSIALSLTGGVCLGLAFTTYILSLEYTSVPNAMFILAAAPFITALLGRIILGETVNSITWLCIIVSAIGLGVMVLEEVSLGKGLGEIFALCAALGFSCMTITLRANQTNDLLPTIFLASITATIFAFIMMIIRSDVFILKTMDWIYSSGMGIFQIGLGFLLFTSGARHLKAVELTLLSLTEIIAGPFLVWIFLDESPSKTTLFGGAIILSAIVLLAVLGSNTKEEHKTILDSSV
ncbi:MAG: EamA family transporter [Deltaproteobacteria bacterium]|nr:EamA family transporter [Deltaproteobacteria bacterium]|tara:strand:- start:5852 stop:6769 length:918 start_codon:yes stop_codon:yes gene_type:complete